MAKRLIINSKCPLCGGEVVMEKLKQFLCGLFTNHCFKSSDTKSEYNNVAREITITETCCKCGKQFSFTAHESKFGL